LTRGLGTSAASFEIKSAILALNNGLPEMVQNQAKSKWHKVHNSSIEGKTLLIYGVGHIGGDTAQAAKYFGLNVLGIRRSDNNHDAVDQMYKPADLHDLLPRSDFILVTAPHTPETEHVFGTKEFELMKSGAVVDVFNQEPLPQSSSLWQTPNLIITPHSSSNDPLNHANRSLDILMDNLSRFIAKQPLINVIDLDLQY